MRRSVSRRLAPSLVASFLVVLTAGAAEAQTPRVIVGDVPCIPEAGNAVVNAAAAPVPEGSQVRVYFRREGYGDFYWVAARRLDGSAGAFQGILPIPEPDNDFAEVYAAVYDAAGKPLAQSRVRHVPVTADCQVELDDTQRAEADHLSVGESALGQMFRKLAWWRCEGVRQRINVRGERRDDEVCAPTPLWWERGEMLVPFVVAGAGGITSIVIDEEPPEPVSPTNPQ
jgi:hypothetical protein